MKNSKIIIAFVVVSMFVAFIGCNKQTEYSDDNWEIYNPEIMNAYVPDEGENPSSHSIVIDNDGLPIVEWSYYQEGHEYFSLRQLKWSSDGWVDLQDKNDGFPASQRRFISTIGGASGIMDENGVNHFVYDSDEDGVYYFKTSGEKESIEDFKSDLTSEEGVEQGKIFDGTVGDGPVIALDSRLFPHIVWIEDYRRKIVYIKWDGKNWVCADGSVYDMKDSDPSNPKYLDGHSRTSSFSPSIAVDKDSNPHIVFVKGTGASSEIWYTKWDGQNWDARSGDDITEIFESISLTADKSDSPSIAVDSNGYPHVCWYDQSFDDERLSEIIYIKWDGTNWVCVDGSIYDSKNADKTNPVNVSKNSGFSGYPVLALDRDDNPHIVWENGDKYRTEGIAYVRWNGENWVCPKIGSK